MRWTCGMLATICAWVLSGAGPVAQKPPLKNPYEGNADAIRNGMGYYRSRCADCHGIDARGVRAPDLTQVWASGRTDEGLFNTIRRGVRDTEMPAFVLGSLMAHSSTTSTRLSDARSDSAQRSARRTIFLGVRCV